MANALARAANDHAFLAAAGAGRKAWWRRALPWALALSLAVHVAFSLWPEPATRETSEEPLKVTITELPPPPPPTPAVAQHAPARPAAVPRARPRATPPIPPAPAVVTAPDASPVQVGPPGEAQAATSGPADARTATPPLTEDVVVPGADVVQAKTLPPRVDLAYKVFFGTHGFEIGEATYRFEHANHRYRISTVGRALGLAALLLQGQGRVESVGMITPEGLQPLEFSVDRFNRRGREKAQFDWESGIVTLDGDRTASLETPTFDPLTLMWQYYFTPPAADRLSFSIATTRRVARYTVTREGRERLSWASRTIETERWVRVSDDGKTEAWAWLAPDLRYIPVKMRVTNTSRGTVEAVLDAIRVDDTGETVGRDDMPLLPSPPSEWSGGAALQSMPGYSPPGATFPTMTP